MITQTNFRENGSGVKIDYGPGPRPFPLALRSLVIYELGYGGMITELLPNRVTVETRILHTKDTTTFEGAGEDMQFLAKVAAFHALILETKESRTALIDGAANYLQTLPREVGGLPLFINMAAPLLLGRPSAATALILAMGITDAETIIMLHVLSLEDLVATIELYLETGLPLVDTLTATATSTT